MVPSRDEGQRLIKSIVNCRIRHFKDHSHTLLMVNVTLLRRVLSHQFLSLFVVPRESTCLFNIVFALLCRKKVLTC